MRPISRDLNPYEGYLPLPRRRPADREVGGTSLRIVPRADEPVAADVEMSVRMFADGGSITVRRRLVAQADGTMATVGIEALIR